MKRKYLLKRVIGFMIVLIGALTLVACKDSELKIPYGSLDDTVYLSGTGYKITNKELYKEMRTSDLNVLKSLINKIIYADEIKKINEDPEAYLEDFIDVVNDKIFYTDDIEDLKDLTDDVVNNYVAKFVDLLYLDSVKINKTDVDTVNFKEHSQVIFDYYIVDVAKKTTARILLDEEVYDEDTSYYIDVEKDLQNYYNNEVKKTYPLSSINVRFTNSYEATQTLRHFGLKTYRSKWYLLPDPRSDVVDGYALDVLKDLDLESKNGSLSEAEHQDYYDSYVVNPTREPAENADVSLTLDEVLHKFFEIYNFVYPYNKEIDPSLYPTLEDVLNDPLLVSDDEENKGSFTKFHEDYPSQQASLRDYIYNTLSTDEDGTRYTASPRSYGNYYFISFKLQDHNEDIKDHINEDDELIIYVDEEAEEKELTDYAKEYFKELTKTKLTTSYIESKFSEKLEDAKIVIYDELIYLHLNAEGFPVTLSKKGSSKAVAKVDKVEILVDELFPLLVAKVGPTIGMDLAIKEVLFASEYMDKITSTMKAEYRENVENVIRQFSQGAYEASGMPASMGRKNFLRLAFGSETIEGAVEKVYIRGELERLFLLDYEKFYGEDVYDTFADLAKKTKDQFFTITSAHLLVYVDMDEDDTPDNPEDFFETLDEVQVLEYKEMVLTLIKDIHDRASKYSSFAAGLQSVVNDFNNSTKYRTDLCDAEEGIEYRPECTWAEYKRFGFFLKYEDLGTINNKTNYPDSGSGFDQDFFERIANLYEVLKEEYYDVDEKFPSQLFDAKPVKYEATEGNNGVLETAFGWHLILATGGDVSTSAKFTYNDDTLINPDDSEGLKIFEEVKIKDRDGNELIINPYTDGEYITTDQVRIYLYESATDRGVVSIPSDVLNTLNNYFVPLKTKYESDYMKMHLLNKLFNETDYTFTNLDSLTKLEGILEINVRQFLEYSVDNDDDALFLDIYGNWFNLFE